MQDLKEQLNELWAGSIEDINFDFLRGLIKLKISVVENNNTYRYEILFQEVSAHYYLKNNGDSRFIFHEVEEGDYLELSSIDYFESGVGKITINSQSDEWVDEYYSSANFVLEIWNSILFVEAKSITINGRKYDNLI
ncbi:MAG: hypothetical protein H0Z32_08845 [Bacillaceae bacterium]|nr:hypothetical protein [Bacillaceae bacterium]